MFIYARSEQRDLVPIYKYTAYQNLSMQSEIHPGQNFIGSRTKKTKLYSRFLPLRIYPNSPVHTSANTESIQICSVMGKCIYTVI